MDRRRFFALLAGAATAPLIGPLIARAQQSTVPVVGFVRSTSAATSAPLLAAMRKGLAEAGFVEGEHLAIEQRYADDNLTRLPTLIADLVRLNAAVIVGNYFSFAAAMAAAKAIPIVFVSGTDPVRTGLVKSLNKPGGNVTGITYFGVTLTAKRLELLHELAPKSAAIAVLLDPNAGEMAHELRQAQETARALGREIMVMKAANARELEAALATIAGARSGALLVGAGAFLNTSQRRNMVAFAARERIIAIYPQRQSVVAGGLMSYGNSQPDAYRQAGLYVARILKGDKPADLPVMQPTKFELVINIRTAKALGLQIPPTVLARADEVIE